MKVGFLIQTGVPHVRNNLYNHRSLFNTLSIRSFKHLAEIKSKLKNSSSSLEKWIKPFDQIVLVVKTSQGFDKSWSSNELKPLLEKITVIGTAAVGSDHIDFEFIKKNPLPF